jgi:CRISPR-associated protein Cas1
MSVRNKQLLCESIGNESMSVPLEDLSVVVLESQCITLTSALLSEFATNKVVVFSCDSTHQPSGVFFPFHKHSRYSEMAYLQIGITEPLKKRLWERIVRQKIFNQAMVLKLLNKDNVNNLTSMSNQVRSGDSNNREGYAANIYWKSLFSNFVRNNNIPNVINSALNYGYAILRGAVVRNIVTTGLLPCFGIHHTSKLNQFNLADDLMEPFRPFLDYLVANIDFKDSKELTSVCKKQLLSVLMHDCTFNRQKIQILKAIEMSAETLAKAMCGKDFRMLSLPELKDKPQLVNDNE